MRNSWGKNVRKQDSNPHPFARKACQGAHARIPRSQWGEKGYIRLSRAKDSVVVEDTRPADGSACKPYPKEVPVAGECACLSDSSYPTGVSAGPALSRLVEAEEV